MVMVGVTVQVVAVDSQSTGNHHTFNWAPASVLRDGRAAIVSIGFSGKIFERELRDGVAH